MLLSPKYKSDLNKKIKGKYLIENKNSFYLETWGEKIQYKLMEENDLWGSSGKGES